MTNPHHPDICAVCLGPLHLSPSLDDVRYPLHLPCAITFLLDAVGITATDIDDLADANGANRPKIPGAPRYATHDEALDLARRGALGDDAQAFAATHYPEPYEVRMNTMTLTSEPATS